MENASKALIMVAEILIGVMIISVGVYLFNMFANYSSERYKKIEDTQIAEFNSQFLIYYGNGQDGKPIECTIHNIVGLANLAQKNNLEKDLIEKVDKTNGNNDYQIKSNISTTNSEYIQIDLGNIKNLELKSEKYITNLIKQNDLTNDYMGNKTEVKYFRCTDCTSYGSNKKINYVRFVEI